MVWTFHLLRGAEVQNFEFELPGRMRGAMGHLPSCLFNVLVLHLFISIFLFISFSLSFPPFLAFLPLHIAAT